MAENERLDVLKSPRWLWVMRFITSSPWCELMRRYRAEWLRWIEHGRRQYLKWAELVSTPKAA